MKPTDHGNKPKKAMDIINPGKHRPSDSSRHIIVTNDLKLQDPMVIADAVEQPFETEPVQGPPALPGSSEQPNRLQPHRSLDPESLNRHVGHHAVRNYQLPDSDLEEQEETASVEPLAEIDHTIDLRPYQLPKKSRRRSKLLIVVVIIVILIVIAVVLDVALYRGWIHISGVKPITHFPHHLRLHSL